MAARVCVIAGPTASGKSRLAMALHQVRSLEIINADSMQVYKGMDIGTAKATLDMQQEIPHHLIDTHTITEQLNVHHAFESMTDKIREVVSRNRLPVVVGGAGFYMRWLLRGQLNAPARNIELSNKIEQTLIEEGSWEKSLNKLKEKDPVYAQTISTNDYRRLARAFELMETTGKPLSSFVHNPNPLLDEFDFRCFFLTQDRRILMRNIDFRVEKMIQDGLIQEVIQLKKQYGCPPNNPITSAIGYREVMDYISLLEVHVIQINIQSINSYLAEVQMKPELSKNANELRDLITKIQKNTRSYARRQWIWFRSDTNFFWFKMESSTKENVDRLIHLLDIDRLSFIAAREASREGIKQETASNEPLMRTYKSTLAIFDNNEAAHVVLNSIQKEMGLPISDLSESASLMSSSASWAQALRKQRVDWQEDSNSCYKAVVEGQSWQVRMNDFPEQPLYTLLINGDPQFNFDQWPTTWEKPYSNV